MSTYIVGRDPVGPVSARTVWGLVQGSLTREPLKASDPESIVRCVMCGSIFRLGDARVKPRGYLAPDWYCVQPSCFGGLGAFVPASAHEDYLHLHLTA